MPIEQDLRPKNGGICRILTKPRVIEPVWGLLTGCAHALIEPYKVAGQPMKIRSTLLRSIPQKTVASHLLFVSILSLGSLIRVAVDTDAGTDITLFSIIFGFTSIVVLSVVNQLTIDLLNERNERWPVLNYCFPAMGVILMIFILQFPIEGSDVLFLATLILIADLIAYSIIVKINATRRQQNNGDE